MSATTIEYTRENIPEIAERLRKGEIGIFPCDTIYGICGCVSDSTSEKIYKAKERPQEKRLIVLSDKNSLKNSGYIIPEDIFSLWPCALTAIVSDNTGETTGIRVPDDPFLMELLPLTGPIFSTSVNISGSPALQSYAEILPVFSDRVDFIVKREDMKPGLSSTLIDATKKPYRILRQGSFRLDESLI